MRRNELTQAARERIRQRLQDGMSRRRVRYMEETAVPMSDAVSFAIAKADEIELKVDEIEREVRAYEIESAPKLGSDLPLFVGIACGVVTAFPLGVLVGVLL